jgi:hypothetical protein
MEMEDKKIDTAAEQALRCRNCPPISPLRCARSWQRT